MSSIGSMGMLGRLRDRCRQRLKLDFVQLGGGVGKEKQAGTYATGRGWFRVWRPMTMLCHGSPRVEVLDLEYGWQDATSPLASIMEGLAMFACQIPRDVVWGHRSRPDLLSPAWSIHILRLGGGGPAVPDSCPPGRVPNPDVG